MTNLQDAPEASAAQQRDYLILRHAGKISHEQALQKAELEFEKFHHQQLALPSQVEKDFEAAVKELKKLPEPGRKKKKP